MMKEEFEKLAGYKVSQKDYAEIIEPMYMAIDNDKLDFVTMINRKRFEVVEEEKPVKFVRVARGDSFNGKTYNRMTPNGCYFLIQVGAVVDSDIKTGKVKVRNLTKEESRQARSLFGDLYMAVDVDLNADEAVWVK